MLSPAGEVTNWNRGAERIKGYSASEIVGEHFSRFYTPEDTDSGLPEKALNIAHQQGRYEAEGWRQRKDGNRFWASVVIDAIYDDGKLVGFAKITRDLTERREAQIQLEQSREQLFQAQKMEAVGQLTGGLANDFNNLLTGISGSLELLKMRITQGRIGDLERYISAAQGATSRAAALTHRLLAFARRQTLDPRLIAPNKLITEMEEMIRRTVGPEIKLELALASRLWSTLCDPNQLENAILNLCINAKVMEAEHAEAALKSLHAKASDIHVLFTDIQMPGTMDGLALAHHTAQNWPWIALLITSGLPRPDQAALPIESRFLSKPYHHSRAMPYPGDDGRLAMRLILHKLPMGQKTVVTDFTHPGPEPDAAVITSPPAARASRRSGPNQLLIPPYFSVAVPMLEELLGGGELGLFDEGRPPSGVLATLLPAAPIAPVPELAIPLPAPPPGPLEAPPSRATGCRAASGRTTTRGRYRPCHGR